MSETIECVAAGVTVVIPIYNQITYTRGCLESLSVTTSPAVEIIIVDNASSDGTADYLTTLSGVSVISNRENLGFAVACNQGIMAASHEWIVVMNNDVLLGTGWLDGMLSAAEMFGLDMVSPAIREGELNYDLQAYSAELTGRMRSVIRQGKVSGICFMAHRRVFDAIGVFDENFRIGQYEDKDLFLRAAKAGFKLGTVGAAFVHHFGSITQKEIGKRRETPRYALANKEYFNRKWRLSWWRRALDRNWNRLENRIQSMREKRRYGHTLMEKWIAGRLVYE